MYLRKAWERQSGARALAFKVALGSIRQLGDFHRDPSRLILAEVLRRVSMQKPQDITWGFVCWSGTLPSSVDGEKVAYTTLDGVDRLLGIYSEAVPRSEVVGDRDGICREPVVQIFDTET